MKTSSGFIALISILIISSVLLITTLGLAQFGIANRFFILHLEQKAQSVALSEACIHIARIKIYSDSTYSVVTPLSIGIADGTCVLYSVQTTSTLTVIKSKATVGESISNLCVVVNTTTGDFTSWREVSHFTNELASCP